MKYIIFEFIPSITLLCFLKFLYFFYLLIYWYVHTLFGPSLPSASWSLPVPHTLLDSRQNLFCSLLQFCWREDISNNKKDIAFLLIEIRIAIQRFLALLPYTYILQPELIHLYQTFSLLPIVISVILRLL
jgi:hypothetical protein